MPKALDLQGRRFGRLLVLHRVTVHGARNAMWSCKCDCGGSYIGPASNMVSGQIVSCGCYSREHNAEVQRTHGMTDTPEFRVWKSMRERCANPKNHNYKNYGGRGISVCSKWQNDFMAFFADMGKRPSHKHTIERLDNNRGYEPDNCVWRTRHQQNRNYRLNHLITSGGQTLCLLDWSHVLGIPRATIYALIKTGISGEEAVDRIKCLLRYMSHRDIPKSRRPWLFKKYLYSSEQMEKIKK